MATPQGVETRKRNELIRRFGTSDIMEILGPAGTIPPTQSIGSRLAELGYTDKRIGNWAKSHIPAELYASIWPFQKELSHKARIATFQSKYGGNSPMCSKAVQAKSQATCLLNYGVANPMYSDTVRNKQAATCIAKYGATSPMGNAEVREKARNAFLAKYGVAHPMQLSEARAKFLASCLNKYGGMPLSLSPEEILRRLEAHDLEPLEPIQHNSDQHKTVKVRCKLCGREFTTRWTSRSHRGYNGAGLVTCGCAGKHSRLELFLREALTDLGYDVASIHPSWLIDPYTNGVLEIDLYFPDLSVGIELDGYAYHNTEVHPFDVPKRPEFHALKSQLCLEHGVRLYHFWYSRDCPESRRDAMDYILGILSEQVNDVEVCPGDTLNRDNYPDPSIFGLPYMDLGPQPFTDPEGHICYTSGLWQFYTPENQEIQNGTSGSPEK